MLRVYHLARLAGQLDRHCQTSSVLGRVLEDELFLFHNKSGVELNIHPRVSEPSHTFVASKGGRWWQIAIAELSTLLNINLLCYKLIQIMQAKQKQKRHALTDVPADSKVKSSYSILGRSSVE
jgi:hypothetical protein